MDSISKSIDLLLVEDDASDIELTSEVLQESRFNVQLNVVRDGMEAIAYLKHQSPYELATIPHLILLDLNLPRKNGQEVLREIRMNQETKHIPVIVLTTSNAESDVLTAYQIGANCYIPKPIDLDGFIKAFRTLEDFWFSLVLLPKHS